MRINNRKLTKWKSQGIQRSYSEKRNRIDKQLIKDIELDEMAAEIANNISISLIDEDEDIYDEII